MGKQEVKTRHGERVAIVAGLRTPFARQSTEFSQVPAVSRDLAPCDLWLFPKLRGCHYETIEEMKEAVTKVIDTLTQEDFDRAFQKLLEQFNKCITSKGTRVSCVYYQ